MLLFYFDCHNMGYFIRVGTTFNIDARFGVVLSVSTQ